jgi:hypothetical protein
MEFMGISIGILALVATAMLLFGRRGTLKILAWLVILTVLGIGGTVGILAWNANKEQWKSAIAAALSPKPATPAMRDSLNNLANRGYAGWWAIFRDELL